MSAAKTFACFLLACCLALCLGASAAFADEGGQANRLELLGTSMAPREYVLSEPPSDDASEEAADDDSAREASSSSSLSVSGYASHAGGNTEGSSSEMRGTCGENLSWVLEDGVLVISGTDAMDDFSRSEKPGWADARDSIVSVVIKWGATSIGAEAFADCRNLRTVSIPSSVKTLGKAAFYGCSSLLSITLPKGVTVLPEGALAGCASLQRFKAPGIKRIEPFAFQDVAIDTLKLPKSVNEIAEGAFFHSSIVAFVVESGNKTYLSKAGVLYTDGDDTLFAYPSGRSSRLFSIPAGVTRIAGQAFLGSDLKAVEIPSTVTEIGRSAFQDCAELTSVSLPDSVETVGDCAFFGSGVESVKFGKGLRASSSQMFRACHNLRTINFGGITELGDQSFADCTSLVSVTVPATVKSIGIGAFGCSPHENPQLKSVTLLGIHTIPFQCFVNQTSLATVNLPKSLKEIECTAFMGCSKLRVVKIPTGVDSIHPYAFPYYVRFISDNKAVGKPADNGGGQREPVCASCAEKYSGLLQAIDSVNQR